MSSDKDLVRWVAPATQHSHVDLALVRHGERLFSFSELLGHVPKRHAFTALQAASGSPQELWDALSDRWPAVANRAVTRCRPRDGEVLDLLVVAHEGSA